MCVCVCVCVCVCERESVAHQSGDACTYTACADEQYTYRGMLSFNLVDTWWRFLRFPGLSVTHTLRVIEGP